MIDSPQKRRRLILVLGLLSAIGPFSVDMYLPAFPAIADGLDTTVSRVVLSLSSFFIGISAGQLLYGPLMERFGRKTPLYAGLSIYIVASIACAFIRDVDELILLRFLQAIGSCSGMVAARAIVRDLFDVKDNARVFSSLMLVIAVSPIIAPTAGGYVTALLGWRYVFFALSLIGAFILTCVVLFLPESKGPNPNHSLKPVSVLKDFGNILIKPQFYVFALTGSVASAGLYAYISGSPPVFMEFFSVTEREYGWIFAIVALGIITASQLNTILLRRFSSEMVVRTALSVQAVIALVFVALAATGLSGLYTTIAMSFCYISCQGFIFPNASALTMANFGHAAGNASALMGAVQMGIGATASAMVGVLQDGSMLPMPGVMAVCTLLALTIFLVGHKVAVKQPSLTELEEEDVDMVQRL